MSARPPGLRRRCCRTWPTVRPRGAGICPSHCSSLGVALLLVGFARPTATMTVKRQEATVVLVLDVSGSMAARDSLPTRLAAAKAVALRYVDALPDGYRMSVVTFSDHAAVAASPTHDLTAVRAAIAKAQGRARRARRSPMRSLKAVDVGRSVKGTQTGKRPPAVVVLLSDGGQTAGRVTPQQAAAAGEEGGDPRVGGLVRHARRRRPAAAEGRVHRAHPGARSSRPCCSRSRGRAADGSTRERRAST